MVTMCTGAAISAKPLSKDGQANGPERRCVSDVVPAVHMWTKRKPAWIGLPPDADVYDEAVPIDRLRAIFALNLG